jgi:hypothetical protein
MPHFENAKNIVKINHNKDLLQEDIRFVMWAVNMLPYSEDMQNLLKLRGAKRRQLASFLSYRRHLSFIHETDM